nr:nitroreductase family protein [Planococcus sp. MB-3u-03]
MNPIDQLIMERRSIKKFKPDAVDVEEIIDLLNIAKWAPNHKVNEPWRFQLYAGAGKEKFVQAFLDSMKTPDGDIPQKRSIKLSIFATSRSIWSPSCRSTRASDASTKITARLVRCCKISNWLPGSAASA